MSKLRPYIDEHGHVWFLDSSPRKVFQVRACEDGKSIEVRAVEGTFMNGSQYLSMVDVRPRVENVVEIHLRERKDF